MSSVGYGDSDAKMEAMTQTQKKTFTRWMNYFLSERMLKVDDLFKDLKDGIKLIHLLELISSKKLPKFVEKPKINLHEIQNLNIALTFVKDEGLKLVNIDSDDINKGNPKLTLGLIWTIILRYQIQQGGDGASPKQELLEWVNKQTAPYRDQGIPVAEDFVKSWQDGKILSALADSLKPGMIDCKGLKDPLGDTQNAMTKSEENFGIPQLVDASDMVYRPDEHSNMTYISYFRDYLENEAKRRGEVATKGPRAGMCFAKGKGVEGGFARRPMPFTIHSRTVNDTPVTGKFMQDFKVVVTGPAGEVPAELKNNNDGTFFCKYIAPVSGDYKVAIDLVGNDHKGESHGPIKGSVYPVTIREPSDPTKSWAEGPGLERAIEGQPALFTVHARDKDGKPVAGDNVKCDVKLIEKAADAPGGTHETPAEVKDNGDGTYSVRYDPKVPGKYRVNVTINDEAIKDMPKDVVCGRAVDAGKSIARGPGVTPGEPRVGLDAPFVVIAKDKTGTNLPCGGNEVKVTVTGPSGTVPCEVKDEGTGTYKCNYVPPVPGDYTVDVKIEGSGVKDNPFKLNIKKPADPSKSYAEGPGLEHAFDNRPGKFRVHALDEDGKHVSGEPVDVKVLPVGGGEEVPVQLTDNGDGTYDVAYMADKPGKYVIHTNIRGDPIKDMPKEITCYPGVDASKTTVEGPGVEGGFAGRELPFTIKSKDKEGKPVTVGGDEFKVVVTGPDGPFGVDVKDNGDGTYSGAYTPKKPGNYQVMVNVNRQKAPVGKSPYTAKVRAGASPKESFAIGRGWEESYDCLPAKFTIHAKDPDGHPVPGEIVRVIMKNVTPAAKKAALDKEIAEMDDYLRQRKIAKVEKLQAERKKAAEDSKREAEAKGEKLPEIRIEEGGDVPVEIRDNGDGSYAAEYIATTPGIYSILVLIGPDGVPIKNSPKEVPVHLAKPKVVFWKHTYSKQKEELETLRKRMAEAEELLAKNGLRLS